MADSPLDLPPDTESLADGLDSEQVYFVDLPLPTKLQIALGVFTIFLLLAGSLGLIVLIYCRRRGSWTEALAFLAIQIIWQCLSWYYRHIWLNFYHDNCFNFCEYQSHIFKFVEHLFYGGAVFSAVLLVGRLEGLGGVLMWILATMSLAAPLLFAVVYLLVDLTLDNLTRVSTTTLIAIEVSKTVWLNLIPIGLLICWYLGQGCESLTVRSSSSTRQTASRLLAIFLVFFHAVQLAGSGLYIATKSRDDTEYQLSLADAINWLKEAGYLVACLALPWAWLIGLLIPRRSANDPTEMNLKLAKQNKSRNIIKYKKAKNTVEMPTFTSTPIKEAPPQDSTLRKTGPDDSVIIRDPLTEKGKGKRNSYTEALEDGSFVLDPPISTKSKSADYLWLPSAAKQLPV